MATPYSPLRPRGDTFTALDRAEDRFGEGQDVARGLVRTATGMTASGLADEALRQEVAQQEGWQQRRDDALRTQQEAAAYAPRVSSLRDATGIGDIIDFAQGAAPGAAVSTLPALGAAVLTRGRWKPAAFAGAAAPSYFLSRGEIAGEQYADPTLSQASAEDRDRAATLGGAAMAGLEAVMPGGLANSLLRTPARSFARNVAGDAVTEGLTELAQTGVQQYAHNTLDPERGYDGWEMLDSAVAGALGGGALSGVGRAPSHLASAALDAIQTRQQGAQEPPAAAPDPTPPPAPIDPNMPLLPAPETLGDRAQEFYDGLAERFGPKVEDAYGKASEFVSETMARANEALRTAETPQDFIAQVFRPSAEAQAAADLRPDTEDPSILEAADPAAAMQQRDVDRAARAAGFAEELLNDPATPQMIRDRIAGMGGDFSSPGSQAYVASTLIAVKGGQRVANAVADLVDFAKSAADKVGTVAKDVQDKVSKKNLQDINDADIQPVVSLLAQRLGPGQAADAPKLARQLVAAANRLSPDAQITEDTDRRLRSFSAAIDDEVLDAVTTASGSDGLRNAIAKVRAIPSAEADVRQAGGQSFLQSMLKQPLDPGTLDNLAKFVDATGLQLKGMSADRKNQVLGALASAFGSKREAQVVVEYYGNMKRDAFRREAESGQLHEDRVGEVTEMFLDQPGRAADSTYEGAASTAEWGALTENAGPGTEVGFRSAAAKRPFRKFAGERLSDGKSRREAWRAINDARGREDADYGTQDYSEFLAAQGVAPEEGLSMVRRDIESRIAEHEARKGEDRSSLINELRGELELLETTASDKGAKAALDQYEVTTRSARSSQDYVATDYDLKEMQVAARARPETVVEFRRANGKTLKLSAESMVKALGVKRQKAGGVQNPKPQTSEQTFADAVAAVLARDDIAGLASDLRKVVLDPESGRTVERSYNPDRLEALSRFEQLQNQNSGGVPARRAFIKAQLQELENALDELGDPTGSSFDPVVFDELRAQWEFTASEAVQRAQKRVEVLDKKRTESLAAYREATNNAEKRTAYQTFERDRAAFDYARDGLQDYRGFDRSVRDLLDDVQRERDEAERSGVPENDDTDAMNGPLARGKAGMRKQTTLATDAVLAANPELLTVLDARGEPKDSKWSEADVRKRVFDAYAKLSTKALEARRDALRARFKDATGQDAATLKYIGQQINSVLDARQRRAEQPTKASARDEEQASWYARESSMNPKKGRPGKIDREAIIKEIARLRGKDVKVLFDTFAKIGGSGEFSMNRDKTERVIKVAVNAGDPMGVAWHESLHDFFAMLDEDRVGRSIKRDLIAASNAPHVKKRLRELLADHPKALEQIEKSAEERVAYMYQFWAAGDLTVGPTGTGIFEQLRKLFRDLLHIVGRDERALDLLTALHEGKFADPSIVGEVLADMPRDRIANRLERMSPALTDTLKKLAQVAPDRLRAYQNDTLNELSDLFSSEEGELGFVQRRFQKDGEWTNKLAGVLAGTSATERRVALDNLQAMKPPSSKLETQLADFFGQMHDYMTEAGVQTFDSKTQKWVPVRRVKNYFPRVFDRERILKDRDGFRKLLMQHGGMSAKSADNTINALTHGTGQLDLAENEHSLGFSPYAKAVQDRQLTFINDTNAGDFAKYQSKDLADITTMYVKQAVHRGEYARLFGNNGEKIAEMIGNSGITDKKELEDVGKIVQGLEGTLGYEMSNQTKELMSGVMTLQNLVILPLAIFSQMIDPIVLAARSGDIKDAGNAYMTALKRLTKNEAEGEDLAEMLGIISQDTVLDAMGVAYGTTHMSRRMRNINRVFFKYNGMQGWNNSMRIAATAAGERYLLQNKDNAAALAELGLEPSDIKTVTSARGVKPDANNKVVMRERLDVSSPKVKEAMFRFVDQSVLRPSASNRPVWMSDPKFLLVAHLKQFTFAMHNVVLKRANQQLDEGNPKPWAILALAMPTILAADMAKFALTGGPPPGWGAKEFLAHAVERSGLLGLGDFGAQAMNSAARGKLPGEELLGPSVEHLADILRWLGGSPGVGAGDVVDRTVPGARFI